MSVETMLETQEPNKNEMIAFLNVRIDPVLRHAVMIHALRNGMYMPDVVHEALMEYLDETDFQMAYKMFAREREAVGLYQNSLR